MFLACLHLGLCVVCIHFLSLSQGYFSYARLSSLDLDCTVCLPWSDMCCFQTWGKCCCCFFNMNTYVYFAFKQFLISIFIFWQTHTISLYFPTCISSNTSISLVLFMQLHQCIVGLYYKRGCKSTPPVGVQVPLFLHSLPLPTSSLWGLQNLRSASESGLGLALECKTQGKSSIHAHCVIWQGSFWVDIW